MRKPSDYTQIVKGSVRYELKPGLQADWDALPEDVKRAALDRALANLCAAWGRNKPK